jgi:hypothetical protein
MQEIKEYIHETIDKLNEADLNEVYLLLQRLSSERTGSDQQSLFSKLQRIQIEGPEGFAANCDDWRGVAPLG